MLDDAHRLETAEQVGFTLELAGVGSRALATLLDLGVMGSLLLLALLFSSALENTLRDLGGFAWALYFVLVFAIQWGYGVLFEWRWQGRTLGKRALGLQVVSSQGGPLSFTQAAIRNLLRIVDLLPGCYLVGATCAWLDRDARRLGDIAAGTLVVRPRRAPAPLFDADADADADAARHALRSDADWALAVTRLRGGERAVMHALQARRELLPLPVRAALFAKLARHLEALLTIERPETLSPERFVLHLNAMAARDAALVRDAQHAHGSAHTNASNESAPAARMRAR